MADTLTALAGLLEARQVGGAFRARCPAHEDSSPSLTIARGQRQPVVVHCFAGCETRDILAALDLPEDFLSREDSDVPVADAAPERTNGAPAGKVQVVVARTRYVIRNPDGSIAAIHRRREFIDGRKAYSWHHPDDSVSTPERPVRPNDLPLYRSEHFDPSTRPSHVFVVEGEKAADALARLSPGAVVLGTVCGASSTPSAGPLSILARQTVVLWPDRDAIGLDHMQRVARALAGVAGRVMVLDVSGTDLPEHGDAADWTGTWGDILDLVVEAGSRPLARPAPEPATPTYTAPEPGPALGPDPDPGPAIVRLPALTAGELAAAASPDWPELSDVAYHGVAGAIVRSIEPYTEADPAGILLSLLTAAGVALGRNRVLSVAGAGVQAANLFTMLVGDSATGRKGTAVGAAIAVMRRADPTFVDKVLVPGLGSGEGLIAHLRREVERAGASGSVAEYRVLVDESEMARLLTAMGRDGSTLSAILRAAFDGTPLGRAVVTSTGTVTWHHVGILGQVTPGELRDKLALSERSNGFANRFLWAAVRQQRLVPLAERPDRYVDQSLVDDLAASLADTATLGSVGMTPDAERVWVDLYAEMMARARTRTGTLAGLTSREVVQVLRVATVYALLDRLPEVGVGHLAAARAIVDYSIASARWIWRTTTGDADADAVLSALIAEGPLAWQDLRRDYGLRAGDAERVVAMLVDAGVIVVYTEASRGRPRRYLRLASA